MEMGTVKAEVTDLKGDTCDCCDAVWCDCGDCIQCGFDPKDPMPKSLIREKRGDEILRLRVEKSLFGKMAKKQIEQMSVIGSNGMNEWSDLICQRQQRQYQSR